MEVWLDYRHSKETDAISNHQFDKIISQSPIKDTATLTYSENSLFLDQTLIGTKVLISDSYSQSNAKKFIGSVAWIVLEFEDWSMIPIENLIAASQDTPTKIAAKIRTPEEAQGAGFALETGVDALIVENEQDMIEAAFIIKSQRGEQEEIKFEESSPSDDIIIAGSAVSDKLLSEFAKDNSLGGFEFLSCIPGTVGGGIKMNAGCFGREFKDILISIQAITKSGQVITIPVKEVNFKYRDSKLSDDLIFLSASFKGFKKNLNLIENEMIELKKKKELAQPTRIKTSGSTFKNPLDQTDKKVWQLIKESVPDEKSFGDACISKKHCNFFVNKGDAKFEDMKRLIEFVSESVLKKTGVKLEKEIKILE